EFCPKKSLPIWKTWRVSELIFCGHPDPQIACQRSSDDSAKFSKYNSDFGAPLKMTLGAFGTSFDWTISEPSVVTGGSILGPWLEAPTKPPDVFNAFSRLPRPLKVCTT